ncbi:MAG: hypothetical protein D6677_14065 [Calditrichaeota bacterium]|nr:MAG: hypothetical protein D6677_14065 [Calditrichota bacterium]
MTKPWARHLISLALVSLVLISVAVLLDKATVNTLPADVKAWLELPYLDWQRESDRALVKEMLDYYQPDRSSAHKDFVEKLTRIDRRKRQELARGIPQIVGINPATLHHLWDMYIRFILIYAASFLISYYGAVTLGLWKFIREAREEIAKPFSFLTLLRRREKDLLLWKMTLRQAGRRMAKAVVYMLFFSPAYVIAYSFKSRFDTDMFLFVMLLGVISNGMLITYTQKFYTFLRQEKEKGYVALARVKGLSDDFRFNTEKGIALKNLLHWRKKFPGHLLDVIYENARYPFLRSLREMAAYLISSLVITEMALNVQGHLSYGMLQYVYYGDYAPVVLIVLGLFWLVKITEMIVDGLACRMDRRLGHDARSC